MLFALIFNLFMLSALCAAFIQIAYERVQERNIDRIIKTYFKRLARLKNRKSQECIEC